MSKKVNIVNAFPGDREFVNEMTLISKMLYYLGCLKKTSGKVYGYNGKMRYERNYKFRLWHPITVLVILAVYFYALVRGIVNDIIRSTKEFAKVVKDGVDAFVDKEIRRKTV